MDDFKITRANTRTDRYEAPVLFPEFYRYGPTARRQYLERELVKLAKEGTLFVTDILNQPGTIPDEAGGVILGHMIDNYAFRAGVRVPVELLDYRVHIKSRNGQNIRWCRDMVKGEAIGGRREGTGGFAPGPGGVDVPVTYHRVSEEWVETEQQDVKLRLQDAWIALKEAGAFCVSAKRAATQAKAWRFEEVRPVALVEKPVEEKPKRRGFAEANG